MVIISMLFTYKWKRFELLNWKIFKRWKKPTHWIIQSSTDKFFFQYKFIPVYLLPALMIYVGLLGGASYVNIFYLLLHEDKYPEEDREFCINIVSLFITGGKQFCSYLYCQVQFLSLSFSFIWFIFLYVLWIRTKCLWCAWWIDLCCRYCSWDSFGNSAF